MNISFEILKIIETLKPENREREREKKTDREDN